MKDVATRLLSSEARCCCYITLRVRIPTLRRGPGASVTECNVRGNELDAESATLLAKVAREKRIMLFGIKHDQTEASFQACNLGPVDAILIASDLSVSAILTTLDVRINPFGREGEVALRRAAMAKPTLKLFR